MRFSGIDRVYKARVRILLRIRHTEVNSRRSVFCCRSLDRRAYVNTVSGAATANASIDCPPQVPAEKAAATFLVLLAFAELTIPV